MPVAQPEHQPRFSLAASLALSRGGAFDAGRFGHRVGRAGLAYPSTSTQPASPLSVGLRDPDVDRPQRAAASSVCRVTTPCLLYHTPFLEPKLEWIHLDLIGVVHSDLTEKRGF